MSRSELPVKLIRRGRNTRRRRDTQGCIDTRLQRHNAACERARRVWGGGADENKGRGTLMGAEPEAATRRRIVSSNTMGMGKVGAGRVCERGGPLIYYNAK
eukprot:scaffold40091_cov60-Phaeocystis_antarctica.AAC.1